MAALVQRKNPGVLIVSPGVLIVLCIALAILQYSHMQVIAAVPYKFEFEKVRLVLKPENAKAISGGFTRLFADLNWLGFVQYYGDPRAGENAFKYAPDFLKLIIRLDPHFRAPYWFASFILAGELGNLEEAKEILDEGIKNNPDDWHLYYIAGFNQYMYNKPKPGDKNPHEGEDLAAMYYEQGARKAGAPPWLAGFAKIMKAHVTTTIHTVIRSWEKIYQDTNNESYVREKARKSLQELWSRVYHSAPNKEYSKRAEQKLRDLDMPLLAKDVLPPENKDQFKDLDEVRKLIEEE